MQFQMLCILESVLHFLNGFSVMCRDVSVPEVPKADSCPLWHSQYTSSVRSSTASPGFGWAHLWICFGITLFHQWRKADGNSGHEQPYLCPVKCSSNVISACLTINNKDHNPAFLALLPFYFHTHSLILLGRKFIDGVSLFSVQFLELFLSFSLLTSLFSTGAVTHRTVWRKAKEELGWACLKIRGACRALDKR